MDKKGSVIYIEDDKLFDYASNTAKLMGVLHDGGAFSTAASLKKSFLEASRCHKTVLRRYTDLSSPPSGCEWLMDNFYLVQREYSSMYPYIRNARHVRSCSGGLVVLELCKALLLCSRDRLDEKRLLRFLDGFQSVIVLRRSELELLPAALSAAVIERISDVCRRMCSSSEPEQFSDEFQALFSSLRLFSYIDLAKLVSAADITDRILCGDPTGEYPRMDRATRADYLLMVEKRATREHTEEHIYAKKLLEDAKKSGKHVGFLLFDANRRNGGVYICVNILLTLFLTLLPAFSFGSVFQALLLLIPISELVKCFIDFVLSRIVKPKRLFRMDTEQGVPPEGRTICVISTLIGDECDAAKLERLYHCCKSEGSALSFGLLADLPTADKQSRAEDNHALAALRQAVTSLNLKYGNRFYLFTRKRSFDGEQYSPRERKRGAIMELAKLLCERENELIVIGDKDALAGTHFILTLDSDTLIYPGSVGNLIGAMLHPLVKPVIDRGKKTVISGHAVIQPRIEPELQSACATDFALIYAGSGGSDPYGALTGELYMDAFGSGGFSGKGLLDASALLCCTDNFPAGRILSHDAPEGAFLRGAYMGDTEFADRFPSLPLAWFERLHRWIRGDWQNLGFIFSGKIRDIDRWRLFDSLRRSLVAPATFIAILFGFFGKSAGLALAAWAALLTLLSRLLLTLAEESMKKRGRKPHSPRILRRHTRLLTGLGGAIVRTFIQLWLLPYEAWLSLSAVVTALWRMFVSHKNLLQWRTAAQSSRERSFSAHIKAMWFPVALGVVLMAFCEAVIGKSAGLMWLFSPAAAAALALSADSSLELAENEEAYLKEAAKRCYKYFSSFFSAEDNFLPPDNFQEQPPIGLAHRTSPTNIALALTSAVAGSELGFLARADAEEAIERIMETLEKLPKFRGHLFNWYNTRSLLPMEPTYISTVDSGNLYAALVCVKQAMIDYGKLTLALRLDALMEKMDFSFLYDVSKGLFHICYDSGKDKGAGGWYDLMASEAMLTSYIAIAKGDIPVKHWRRLSRAQLQKDGYRGLASWTGTMFEYLMPELFLPIYKGSLLYESAKFCVYVQKRRMWLDKPWGISESAFYSLDSAMNYRYKANGCDALALKRGQDSDMVVSPYSSFLSLAIDPVSSIKNLRHLERFGALGKYGFIEAIDFTPSRCRSDSGEAVRCYMAHHMGMSIVAAANAACDGCMQKYFINDARMAAFSLLLQERLPDTTEVIKKETADISERPERTPLSAWILRGGAEDTEKHCCVLSNGAYNIFASSHGDSRAFCGPICIYDWQSEGGIRLEICADCKRSTLIPRAKPDMWELSEDKAGIKRRCAGIEVQYEICAAAYECGEKRVLRLRSAEDCNIRLRMSFVPILANLKDYSNHPAYWQLGLSGEKTDNGLLLHRARRGGCSALWLCLLSDRQLDTTVERYRDGQWLSQPYVQAECSISLRAGEETAVSYALCLNMERDKALKAAEGVLLSPSAQRGNMAGAAAAHMRLTAGDIGFAMELLGKILLEKPVEAAAKSALWKYGLSGEMPILSCDGRSPEAEKLIKAFCLLKSCGTETELAIFSDELGEYRQPVTQTINHILSEMSLENLLNSRGGIYIVPMEAAQPVLSRSVYTSGAVKKALSAPPTPPSSAARTSVIPAYEFKDGAFEFHVNNTLPPRQWQNIITNGSLGYIASDCGGGYMWLDNAREMRLNAPPANICALGGSESLWIEQNEKKISLFAQNDDLSCTVSFSPGCTIWEKETQGKRIKTTAFVPVNTNARILLIEGGKGLRLRWLFNAILGSSDSACVRISCENGMVNFENPESYLEGIKLTLAASMPLQTGARHRDLSIMSTVVLDERTVLFCGFADKEEIDRLCKPETCLEELSQARDHWSNITGKLKLSTGLKAFDAYAGNWCAYQVIACRLMGRSSLYQSGGAIGFRDQLQDAVNILLMDSGYAKRQILECCAHQYTQGDVMHWWHRHPKGDKGIRTRCSDDLLWLCWALCEYCDKTGDMGICSEKVNYIDSPVLESSEKDRYETSKNVMPVRVIDHAIAAIECSIHRGLGAHGLPLFGSGDWNDGMDEVGGESVWLAWFAASCALRMSRLCEKLEIPAQRYARYASRLCAAAENAWTGHWYLRGYYPDGQALGGEERIDSISQSWSVLCEANNDSGKAERAIDAAFNRLTDRKNRLVKLLDPPFSESERRPGYIVSYGEGFRENGGQYTHGAIWLAIALFKTGRTDKGWEILRFVLPEAHDMIRYGAEPFVLSADIYSAEGHQGEAGWTWYTGSAGWYFRAVYEVMLGLELKEGRLSIHPRLPSDFPGARLVWHSEKGRQYDIEISHDFIRVNGSVYNGEALE